MMTDDQFDKVAAALQSEGYAVRQWTGGDETRLYVLRDGREFGYLTAYDDGSTGTCRFIHKSGMFAAIIRKAIA